MGLTMREREEVAKRRTRYMGLAWACMATGCIAFIAITLYADWKTGCLGQGPGLLEGMVLEGDMGAVLRLLENNRLRDCAINTSVVFMMSSMLLSLLDCLMVAVALKEADREGERWRRKR